MLLYTQLKFNYLYQLKCWLFIIYIILQLVNADEETTGRSVFKQVFDNLHKEPKPPVPETRAVINTNWIAQKLDNFNDADTRTWNMRYLSNSEFFQSGNPLFVFVGGEWTITPGYLSGGLFYDIAKDFQGYLVYAEHRYYGQSHPTSDLSLDNLKYLSSKQALADLEHLITTLKSSNPQLTDSKVVVVGASYSASLVTWFRKLYPSITTVAWSSSAPLYAKVNFKEYKEWVGYSMDIVGGKACWIRIKSAISKLENMLRNNQVAEFKTALRICDSFNAENILDVWTVFSTISDVFANIVQNEYKEDIDKSCATIMAENDDISGLTTLLFGQLGGPGCYELTFADSVASLSNTAYNGNFYRQWVYQTCTEFGWYHTSESLSQPFGTQFPISLYLKFCDEVYGIKAHSVYRNVENSNNKYGGWSPQVTNVFWTHGSLDPWSRLGKHINDDGRNNIVPLYGHCKDFDSIGPRDTALLRDSKQRVWDYISRHLNDTDTDINSFSPY